MAKFLEATDVFDLDAIPPVGTLAIKNGDLPSAVCFGLADAAQVNCMYSCSNITIACEDFPRSGFNLLVMAPSFADRAQVGLMVDGTGEGVVNIDGSDYQITVSGGSSVAQMGLSTNQFVLGAGPGEPGKMIALTAPSNLGDFKLQEFTISKSTDDISVFAITFFWWRSATAIA